jgi:hypothetical protein
MSVDLDKRLAEVDKDRLLDVLRQVGQIVGDPSIPGKSPQQLTGVIAQVLEAVTPAQLLGLLRDRLYTITEQTPEDMIAVANPSVRLLNRSTNADPTATDQIGELLDATSGESDYELGRFIINNNPYFAPSNDLVSEQQLIDATADITQGGPFRPFTASFRWDTTRPGFPHIPHPTDSAPSGVTDYQPSWYMVSGRTPKSLPDPEDIGDLDPDTLDRVRNIVKTIEIEYGTDDLFTGDFDGTVPREKPVHIFVMYAGGNGT